MQLTLTPEARTDIDELGPDDAAQAFRAIARLSERVKSDAPIGAEKVHACPGRWQVRLARGLRALLSRNGPQWIVVQVYDKSAAHTRNGLPRSVR